jgi:hypothetical protein
MHLLNAIHFINPNSGWVAASDSRIYKTTNAGNNWSVLYHNGLCGLNSVCFVNDQTGWIANCEGAIHKTTNDGINWVLQSLASTTYINSLRFVNSTTGWAVGASGRILKTTTGGITPVAPISNEIPNEFYLHQNYPNPFNPVTKIKFSLPLTSEGGELDVKLAIYDVLGREVAVLIPPLRGGQEGLNPGTPAYRSLGAGRYEVEFDGTNYPSGVYFYKLKAEGYSETRRMVFLK